MSHFTVLVKLTPQTIANLGFVEDEDVIERAVAALLAPFSESTEDRQYCKFISSKDEYWEAYQNEILDDDYVKEHHPQYFGKTPKECMTWDEYMTKWHSYEIDEEKGEYGYWTNPNGKWDWYTIGGRWKNLLPVKADARLQGEGQGGSFNQYEEQAEGFADYCFMSDLDLQKLELNCREEIQNFYKKYEEYKENQRKFEGRERATLSHDEIDDYDDFVQTSYNIQDILFRLGVRYREGEGRDAPIVENEITLNDLETKYRGYFGFYTYAVLDADGWHAKGEHWGSDEPDAAMRWNVEFMERWLLNEHPDTILVVVDCHS